MINLQTKGFELLTPQTKDNFMKLWEESQEKLERKLRDIESLRIHLKEYSPGGKTKFSIHALMVYSGKTMEADSVDWDLKKAFHKVFNKLQEEIEHKFHISDQNKK